MDSNLEKLITDKDNWHGRNPPFCPNLEEVEIYKKLTKDQHPICLFGVTKELGDLCDFAIDLNPVPYPKFTVKANWFDIKNQFINCIIGDGVVNLYGNELIEHVSTISKTFVARVFMKKLDGMKYAKFFPTDFPTASKVIITQPDVAVVQWNFS